MADTAELLGGIPFWTGAAGSNLGRPAERLNLYGVITFVMRGRSTVSPFPFVYWSIVNEPDPTGLFSNLSPPPTDIVIQDYYFV
jgi:hypothetical protein